jgi:hypothetical protein
MEAELRISIISLKCAGFVVFLHFVQGNVFFNPEVLPYTPEFTFL